MALKFKQNNLNSSFKCNSGRLNSTQISARRSKENHEKCRSAHPTHSLSGFEPKTSQLQAISLIDLPPRLYSLLNFADVDRRRLE